MKKVAFLDIDGTVFRSSLLIELVEVLVEKEIFMGSVRKKYENEKKLWLARDGNYASYIDAVINVFDKNLKGVLYSDFMEAAKIVVTRFGNHIYRYTRDEIKRLRAKGYYIIAISHSPKAVLDLFCERLGFDKVYGRILETGPSDRFTGNVIDLHLISNKANIVRRAVEKEGLTLRGSVGIGDTESDIPILDLVENAICFNPNSELYRYAKKQKWTVIVERKDVVYKIQ